MFPAPAGMNRFSSEEPYKRWYVPRTSGDEPPPSINSSIQSECSPHQRG